MSVGASICRPVTEQERNFHVAVAGEDTYSRFLLPIAEENNLTLCDNWGTMQRVTNQNLEEFVRQVRVLIECLSVSEDFTPEGRANMCERFTRLIDGSVPLFNARADLEMIVG